MCQKMRFGSRGAAKEYARNWQAGTRQRKLYPYACPHCPGCWHLTSLSRQEQRRRFGKAA